MTPFLKQGDDKNYYINTYFDSNFNFLYISIVNKKYLKTVRKNLNTIFMMQFFKYIDHLLIINTIKSEYFLGTCLVIMSFDKMT